MRSVSPILFSMETTRTVDPIADAVRNAEDAHAALLKTGTDREIHVAYRAVLVAQQALYADCGETAAVEWLAADIEDLDRKIAKL